MDPMIKAADTDATDTPDTPEWAEFRQYLKKRGIKPGTAMTYAAQVKRIIGAVPELTTANLNAWIKQFVSRQRTPFRASWRKFRQYYEAKYNLSLPDFSRLDGNDITEEILDALRSCVKGHKIKPQTLCELTTELDTGPRFAALCKTLPGLQSGALVLVLSHEGKLSSVPVDAYRTFVQWGQQANRQTKPHWLLPTGPGGDIAMPSTQIGKLLKANP